MLAPADRPGVFEAFKVGSFDTVVHLAAIHFIPYCNQHPDLACRTNVEGTQNIFDAAQASGSVQRLFTASTAAVYPDCAGAIDETVGRAPMDVYGMTKSAQLSVARGLAETCTGTGVTVNSVLPGPTLTQGAEDFFATLAAGQGQTFDEAARDFFAHGRPTSILKRFIQPDEVASMVAYVCSPLAAATQGAALRVEGGVVRSL